MKFPGQTFRLSSLLCISICILATILEAESHSSAKYTLPAATRYTNFENHPYISPTPGRITIVSSTPLPANGHRGIDILQGIKECGFNVTFLQSSLPEMKQMLRYAKETGIGVMISHPHLTDSKNFEAFVDTFSKYLALRGWSLPDEPRFPTLPALSKYYLRLSRATPNLPIHMNLVGGAGKQFMGPTPSYAAYLDTIQRLFRPGFWSYDLYPISNGKEGKLKIDAEGFYYDLEVFSTMARLTGRPFWAYCMTMPYKTASFSRPAPTEADLRWEAFSPLAYGAQGIVYWTYSQRDANKYEEYLSAPINLDGERTPIWYSVQKVNREIARYDEVFAGCKLVEAVHTGKKNYPCTKHLNGVFGPALYIKTGKEGALCSMIENKGIRYLIIVNHTPLKSQKVKIQFTPITNALLLHPDGRDEAILPKDKKGTYTLPPGGYLIFRL